MAEDRLDKALNAMKNENIDPEKLASARTRVWEKMENQSMGVCSEFRLQFQDYVDKRLSGNRQMLMEDHLSRCPQCRTLLAESKGEFKAIERPKGGVSWWPRWGTWAAAAALAVICLFLARNNIDALLVNGKPRATVASADGGLFLVQKGALKSGDIIGENDAVRTSHQARAQLRLADGSLMELNAGTELSVHRVWSGQSIYLHRGDIIIHAAKQGFRHLRVQTRDSAVSVKGTIFAVSTGISGTVVSVIEGSVAVNQNGMEVLLKPGEQAASNAALARPVDRSVTWSADAGTYIKTLASLAHLTKQAAGLSAAQLRTQSRLLQYIPPNLIIYGAIPNMSGALSQTNAMMEQQAAENPAFSQWWNSSASQSLKEMINRLQTLMPYLGDEIVFGLAVNSPGTQERVPIILAEVQQGKQAELAAVLEGLGAQIGQSYQFTNALLAISDSQNHLQWLLSRLGQGATTPFAAEIAAHYQNGAGWLFGIDMDSMTTLGNSPEFINAQQMKYLFCEQHNYQGMEENEMTMTFKGPRTGLSSFLASSGSGGAAEYISSDALAAGYAAMREPQQLFDELIAQIARQTPSFLSDLAQEEAKLGLSFSNDIARAFGTESAFSFDGLSTAGPAWTMAALVNDSATLDRSIRRLVDVWNEGLGATSIDKRISLEQEVVDGRAWTAIKSASAPIALTWTYDRGYLVASSDRGAALRAIATRNGGSQLIWSSAFQQQLPSSAGLHPSGFVWLNTKGAFQSIAAMIPNPVIKKIAAESDPILVVFSGTIEQIRAVSRTKLSGLITDMMLMQGLSQTSAKSQTSVLQKNHAQPGI